MNNKERQKVLKKRNDELHPIVFVGFETIEELESYRSTIELERIEYFENIKQIEDLEWNLKTPKEQEEILEQRRLSKLKREGKLFPR